MTSLIREKDQFWLGAPPRLLAGAVALFWGAMTGRPLLGLMLAVILEARQWVKVRWDFGESGYVKAWYLTVFMVMSGAVLMWLSDEGGKSLYEFVRWMPVMLLPLELAQRYGKEGKVALNSLFLVARRRMLKDIEEGRNCSVFYIHTGYFYFGACLVAASMSRSANWQHQLGCCILLLWALIGVCRDRKMRWQALVTPVLAVLLVGWFTQSSGKDFWKRVSRTGGGAYEPNGDLLTQVTTRIGTLGSIKNSKSVRWRLWSDTSPPNLLRLNSYNSYNVRGHLKGGSWNNLVVDPVYRSVDDSYETGIAVGGSRDLYVFHPDHVVKVKSLESLQQLHLRSTQLMETHRSTLVLAPMGTMVLGDALGENILPESNGLGVIRVVNREAVLDYKLWVDTSQALLDGPVREDFDYAVPDTEVEALETIVRELGLRDVSDSEKVSILRKWFYTEFRYTKHLVTERGNLAANGNTPLSRFLLKDRAGHCEYFGTAATLLLRQSGVPSRYCVGYSVSEESILDEKMWLMRGTHAHAWSSAFIDGHWIDVDVTPPGWDQNGGVDAWMTAIKDWFQGFQEELRLWKIKGTSEYTVTLLITLGGVLLALIIGLRLWLMRPKRQRQRLKKECRTPLHSLERKWKSFLGERPNGMTLPQWLRMSYNKLDIKTADLERAIALHQELRFSQPREASSKEGKLRSLVKELKRSKKII